MAYRSIHLRTGDSSIATVERIGDDSLSIRVQAEDEVMITDIVIREFEALCLAHSMPSVLTSQEE